MAAVLWIFAIVQLVVSGWLLVRGYITYEFEGTVGLVHIVTGSILFASAITSIGLALIVQRLGQTLRLLKETRKPLENQNLQSGSDRPYVVPTRKKAPPVPGISPSTVPVAPAVFKEEQLRDLMPSEELPTTGFPPPLPIDRGTGKPELPPTSSKSTHEQNNAPSPFPWIKPASPAETVAAPLESFGRTLEEKKQPSSVLSPNETEQITEIGEVNEANLIRETEIPLLSPTPSFMEKNESQANISLPEPPLSHLHGEMHGEIPLVSKPPLVTTAPSAQPLRIDPKPSSLLSPEPRDAITSDSITRQTAFSSSPIGLSAHKSSTHISDETVKQQPVDDLPATVAQSTTIPDISAQQEVDQEKKQDKPPSSDKLSTKERVVVGEHEAGGNRYIMYDDGSIDAETSNGQFHFSSIDEMKDFIARTTAQESNTTS